MASGRYAQTMLAIHDLVAEHVPAGAVVLVASGGDAELLDLGERQTVDFPQGIVEDRGGTYPPPGLVAVAQLETQRARGAEFLLVPSTELWLLDELPVFERHLHQRYRATAGDETTAVLFALDAAGSGTANVWDHFRRTIAECERTIDADPAILDWDTGLDLGTQFPDLPVFSPLGEDQTLPYLDGTVDIVALSASASEGELAEARRVAQFAVAIFPRRDADEDAAALQVEWTGGRAEMSEVPAIVVPCFGPADRVEAFIASLRDSLSGSEAEVILACEDTHASEVDVVRQWAEEDDCVTLLEVPRGTSIGTACNSAAAGVERELLVFVLPLGCLLPDWLAPLVRTFRDRPEAGAAGGRMLTFSGDVLHAGGFLLEGSQRLRVGSNGRADLPLLSCVRRVDYASPALLATRRGLFAELGGFSPDHPSALFVDYSLRVSERGYAVFCQPESTIVLADRDVELSRSSPAGARPLLAGAGG